MSTPLSKKEEGQSTDAGRGAEPEKLIKVEEVGLAMVWLRSSPLPAFFVLGVDTEGDRAGGKRHCSAPVVRVPWRLLRAAP